MCQKPWGAASWCYVQGENWENLLWTIGPHDPLWRLKINPSGLCPIWPPLAPTNKFLPTRHSSTRRVILGTITAGLLGHPEPPLATSGPYDSVYLPTLSTSYHLTHSDLLCPLPLWPLVYIYDFPTPSGPLWSNVMQDWPDGRVWIQTLPPMTPSGPTWAWAQFYQTPGLCLWIPHPLWPNLIQWLARLACCVVWWYLLLLCCMMMSIIVVLYDDDY